MSEFNLEDGFISLLRDKHIELLEREQKLREEAAKLDLHLAWYEDALKNVKKHLGKDAKNKLSGVWSHIDEKDEFTILKGLKVLHNGKEISFFSEAYLYDILGKDDARTIFAILNSLCIQAGKPAKF
jgi:hypothetical protein